MLVTIHALLQLWICIFQLIFTLRCFIINYRLWLHFVTKRHKSIDEQLSNSAVIYLLFARFSHDVPCQSFGIQILNHTIAVFSEEDLFKVHIHILRNRSFSKTFLQELLDIFFKGILKRIAYLFQNSFREKCHLQG